MAAAVVFPAAVQSIGAAGENGRTDPQSKTAAAGDPAAAAAARSHGHKSATGSETAAGAEWHCAPDKTEIAAAGTTAAAI